ncbi:MAG: porphobilinogen synthase [Bacteroidetes bacterium]|nr:porphobilinogen synthase [Bacteroidota bacterium]
MSYGYPYVRGRRLRATAALRQMVQETHLHPAQLIAPLFVIEGQGAIEPIADMPGYHRYTLDRVGEEVRSLWVLGIRSVLLFAKVPDHKKDNTGTEALNPDGLLSRAVQAVKAAVPEMCVMTDVALDPYSSYGHDGIVQDGQIVNDETCAILAQMSVVHARAGADLVAPSDMMDGRIAAIREALEGEGHAHTGILAYSAKYASGFYGPFRSALDSAPGFGDKKTYQMDPANRQEAVREALQDEAEGADIVMVKPGMPYLDIVRDVADAVQVPVAVYQVSGEYSMLQLAVKHGLMTEETAIMEPLLAFRRAGAQLVATYYAAEAARLLNA